MKKFQYFHLVLIIVGFVLRASFETNFTAMSFENTKFMNNLKPRINNRQMTPSSPLQQTQSAQNPQDVEYDDDHYVEIPTVFGEIIRGEVPAEILADSTTLFAFRDRAPRAPLHGLIVPKMKWIPNVFDLRIIDIELLEEMEQMAKNLVGEYHPEAMENDDLILCFHVPPFYSVKHLHLHVLAPASEISNIGQIKYKVGSRWCISFQTVYERLRMGKESAVPFGQWDFVPQIIGTCALLVAVPSIVISIIS